MRHDIHRPGASKVAVIWISAAVAIGLLTCTGAGLAVRHVFGPALGALDESRTSAQQLKSTTIAMQLAQAQIIARREFEDDALTIPFLVEQNYITEEVLQSPFGPVDDAGGDYWLHPAPPPAASTAEAARLVVAYDRAMYQHHERVSVAYLDGAADLLELTAFDALLAEPPNGGVDHELPARR